jgi:hypothetical protein
MSELNAKDEWVSFVVGAKVARDSISVVDLEWDSAVLWADTRIKALEAQLSQNMSNESHAIAITLGAENMKLTARLERQEAVKKQLRVLVHEVTCWHRDKESPDYNDCGTSETDCVWCANAKAALEEK